MAFQVPTRKYLLPSHWFNFIILLNCHAAFKNYNSTYNTFRNGVTCNNKEKKLPFNRLRLHACADIEVLYKIICSIFTFSFSNSQAGKAHEKYSHKNRKVFLNLLLNWIVDPGFYYIIMLKILIFSLLHTLVFFNYNFSLVLIFL